MFADLFPVALAVIAAAYAAVGQAGATGYIAAMGLAGYTPDIIRPAAPALNTLVATIGTLRFAQAGFITWRGTYPFIVLGLPLSVVGGITHIPTWLYDPLVGLCPSGATNRSRTGEVPASRTGWPSSSRRTAWLRIARPRPSLPHRDSRSSDLWNMGARISPTSAARRDPAPLSVRLR